MDKNDKSQHNREADDKGGLPSYEAVPPPYAEAAASAQHAEAPGFETTGQATDDFVKPGILVLDGQRIYSSSDPTVSVYELNRGITNLGHATTMIEFLRIEQRRTNADQDAGGAPTTRKRPRHIYNLLHANSRTISSSSHFADFFIMSVAAPSRRLGHIGLKKSRIIKSPTDHWMAVPVEVKGSTEQLRPPFVAGADALWEARFKQGACKWTDMAGNDVAIEYVTESSQHPQLLVTASLQREHCDALVALWCCRIWEQTLIGKPLHVVPTSSYTSTWKKFLAT